MREHFLESIFKAFQRSLCKAPSGCNFIYSSASSADIDNLWISYSTGLIRMMLLPRRITDPNERVFSPPTSSTVSSR